METARRKHPPRQRRLRASMSPKISISPSIAISRFDISGVSVNRPPIVAPVRSIATPDERIVAPVIVKSPFTRALAAARPFGDPGPIVRDLSTPAVRPRSTLPPTSNTARIETMSNRHVKKRQISTNSRATQVYSCAGQLAVLSANRYRTVDATARQLDFRGSKLRAIAVDEERTFDMHFFEQNLDFRG